MALSSAVRKKLGKLSHQAGQTVAQTILQRGGNASNIRHVGPWASRTLAETAEAAVHGDATAETALKIVKQAKRLGKLH